MMLVGSLAVFAAPLLLPADPAADRTGRGSTSPGRPGDRRAVRLVHGLTIAAESGKATATSVGTLLAATVALGGFVLVQRTRRHPLVPTALLRSPPIAAANVVGFVLGAAVHGLFYVLSLFLGGIRGDEPMLIGLPFLPMTGAIVVGSAATSRLRGRVGAWWLLLASVALLALALATLARSSPASGYIATILPALVLAGLGLGIAFVALTTVAVGEGRRRAQRRGRRGLRGRTTARRRPGPRRVRRGGHRPLPNAPGGGHLVARRRPAETPSPSGSPARWSCSPCRSSRTPSDETSARAQHPAGSPPLRRSAVAVVKTPRLPLRGSAMCALLP